MRKVGILSMQRIKNYGSFLQAYGLKRILESLGCDVQFVDYRVGTPIVKEKKQNNKFSKVLSVLSSDASLKQKIQYIIHKKNFSKKYDGFLGLSKQANYAPELDLLIIGSDEVFNCIQKNSNVGYSLELFGKNNNARKVITYAASFGNTTMEKLIKYNKDKEIGDLLNKLDAISVRDDNSGLIIKKLTNKEIKYNLDPVLIFDYANQKDLIPDIDLNEKYIIVYAYNNRINKDESNWIKKYAKKNNLKVYAIGGAQSCADKFIDCSPFEVLAYFKKAKFIITDTFHGSIFSIIMKKEFVTLVRKSIGNEYGNEEKLSDLLKRLKLEDRMTYDYNDISSILNKEINYNKVFSILNEERNKTINYLKNEINIAKNKCLNRPYKNCCGCGACYNICPKNAITMEEDEFGFVFPVIDKKKCIDCGLCKKVCNYNKQNLKNNCVIKAYAAVSKDDCILKKSASGGVFASIAERFLESNGVVYGCSMKFDDDIEIKHIRIDNKNDLYKLQGSKYVQSEIGKVYKLVKDDLKNGKMVLFSGTPCQIDGLYGFLGNKEYDNLFTIDIICHGVPSQKMFKDYIKFLENKKNIKITDFKFRDKSKGWGLYAGYKYNRDEVNISKVIPAYESSFYQLFLDSMIYRENCYKCPYACNKRVGNITIGDFWGIEKEHINYIKNESLCCEKGVSCLIVNDEYGNNLLDNYGNNLILLPSTFEKVQQHNSQLREASKFNVNKEVIMKIYLTSGYGEVDRWYKKYMGSIFIIKKVWYKIPFKIRTIVKKIIKK